VQCVNFREDIAAAERELLCASKQISASRLDARASSPSVHGGGVGGRPTGGVWRDTGGEMTIHVRLP